MRAAVDLIVGLTMLTVAAVGMLIVCSAEAAVWTVVGWVRR